MKSFSQFILEANSDSITAELHLHPNKPPIVKLYRTSSLQEAQWTKDEPDQIDGKLYKGLGEFKPSSLDHDTITKEFHEHLAKHGYQSHSPSHPLVLSPTENKFKSEFKRRTLKREGDIGGHEKYHHDGGKGRGNVPQSRFVSVWSTNSSTKVRDAKTKEEIPAASKDNSPIIFNDEKVQHKASENPDRWFIRASEIKKIPKEGLQSKDKDGNTVHHGNDMESYLKTKQHSAEKLKKEINGVSTMHSRTRRDVREWHNSVKDHPADSPEGKKRDETLSWMKKEYPQYHPDNL